MKTYNITPGRHVLKRLKKSEKLSEEVELLQFDMTEGDALVFDSASKEDIYFKVNVNFKRHCISRIQCLN